MNKRIGQFLSLLVIGIGGLVLLGWYWDIPLLKTGLTSSLATMKANTAFPGRMGFNTALNFVLMGMALWWLGNPTTLGIYLAQFFSSVAAIISLLALLGHLFEVGVMATLIAYSNTQPIHTALAFLLLYGGILLTNPAAGLMAIITSPFIGGLMVRWLIPWVILFPIMLNFLVLEGYDFGWYDLKAAYGIEATFTIVSFLLIVCWNGYLLNKIEISRTEANQTLQETQQHFKQAVEAAELGTWQWDLITGSLTLSPQSEKLLGLAAGSFPGTYEAFINLLHHSDTDY
jgi:PAS domain-containing protein